MMTSGTNCAKLYVAVTSGDMEDGHAILEKLEGLPLGIKVGLELFVRQGPALVDRIRSAGFPVFLDLKYHDIPFTVAGAVRSACALGPELLNVHASGGPGMMRAAADAAAEHGGGTRVLAVTILTSLTTHDLDLVGIRGGPEAAVVRLALLARESGLHGIVCSPEEISTVRQAVGPEFLIVTPGVRPAGAALDDQKRVATPAEAMRRGASSLVVGRPVTASPDPRAAAEGVLEEMGSR
jgi:orotidine-5'-phosphate decarboxylase